MKKAHLGDSRLIQTSGLIGDMETSISQREFSVGGMLQIKEAESGKI